jgi:hypothetical protein
MDLPTVDGYAEFQARFSMRYKSLTRVLALDLHPRRFGYVVVESPDRLLDWGVRSYRRKGNSADVLIRRRLKPLLELWRPSILVLRNVLGMTQRPHHQSEALLNRIAAEAKNHEVAVRILKKRPGSEQGKRLTKNENARRVAEQFSVLRWKMPPKRKPWESEDYRMSMFTAAVLAMAELNITVPPATEKHPPPARGFSRTVTQGGV